MLMINYKRAFIRVIEMYGDEYSNIPNTDLLMIARSHFPTSTASFQFQKKALHLFGRALVIDLSKDTKTLFDGIRKRTKYEINRAQKRESLISIEQISPTNQDIQFFATFFNSFAKHKNLPECNEKRLKALRDQDGLVLSFIKDQDEQILCSHAYIVNGKQATLLYSATYQNSFNDSRYKNRIGRANRLLHWLDIQSFQSKNYFWYDFGRIFFGANSREQNVNRFKQEFGGIEINDEKVFYPKSFLGKLIILYYKWLWRGRDEVKRAKNM